VKTGRQHDPTPLPAVELAQGGVETLGVPGAVGEAEPSEEAATAVDEAGELHCDEPADGDHLDPE
jgi:hypothetical protein